LLEKAECGECGKKEKVGEINVPDVPVSFCAFLPKVLTFWSLKLKNLHFFSLQKGTYLYISVLLNLISRAIIRNV